VQREGRWLSLYCKHQ